MPVPDRFPVDRYEFGNPWLSEMHEIPAPDAVSSETLAPGVWILLLAVVLWGLSRLVRAVWRWRKHRYRRRAAALLKDIAERCARGQTDLVELRSIPEIIRRVALVSWGRPHVAGLIGHPWLKRLGDSMGGRRVDGLLNELAWLPDHRLVTVERQRLLELIDLLLAWLDLHETDEEVNGG